MISCYYAVPSRDRPVTFVCALQDRLEKKSFFNWFYFAINWGSCLAVTVIVYIQDSVSWAIGFAIPAVAMALAVITFLAGSSLYTHVEPTERCPPALSALPGIPQSATRLGLHGTAGHTRKR